eukprot:TRINITY_DN17297_c0_g3_i1.p1 TRINITY_DN17297_c0_g3~~TRINITY_DN17297_c0_g3_i1.p1  ORF type:complete len:1525 (+),score=267.39 TRINITY_DN17297_c0_g3_i1:168-4577(+)
MTVRNNNSSRFGKWLEISVDKTSKRIQSCCVKDFLLEITRVCSPGASERNYHVFFQLTANRDSEALSGFNVKEPKQYSYLKDCLDQAPGVDDMKFFEELVEAFKVLNFDEEMRQDIFNILIGILCIGNCSFVEGQDEARLVAESSAAEVAKYWSVDARELIKALTIRKINVGKEVTESPRTPAQAKAAREAFAKLIYGKLFKFLIVEINKSLSDVPSIGKQMQTFGVLDIAGFESFYKNSLEQLHINLSNEYMQQHFNNHIFMMEMVDYIKEGVDTGEELTFNDNKDILALIIAKGGIFALLDEETALPKGSDNGFMNKLIKAQGKHGRLVVPRIISAGQFGIRHFAGTVTYSVEGFLEKNLDKPPAEAADLCTTSSCQVIKRIGELIGESGPASGGKSVKTVSGGFKHEMSQLLEKLEQAEPHYIRCVKPNPQKVPDDFNAKITLEQLTCSGVMEAVHIRQQGFAARIPFDEFVGQFACVLPKSERVSISNSSDSAERVAALVKGIPAALSALGGVSAGELVIGRTKVFIKSRVSASLQKARDISLIEYVLRVQACHRGSRCRKSLHHFRRLVAELDAWSKENNLYSSKGSQYTAIEKFKTVEAINAAIEKGKAIQGMLECGLFVCPPRSDISRTLQRMEAESSLLAEFPHLLQSFEPVEISSVLARASELELPRDGHIDTLSKRLTSLKVQVPLAKAMREALASDVAEDLTRVFEGYKASDLSQNPDNWIEGLDGAALAGQLFEKIEVIKSTTKLANDKQERDDELQKSVVGGQRSGAVEVTALAVKEEEEEEEKGPAKRKTITGLDISAQGEIMMRLMNAAHEYDIDALKTNLALAWENGVEESELKKAQSMFDSLSTEAGVVTAIEDNSERLNGEDGTESAKLCLENLTKHAGRVRFATAAVLRVTEDSRRRARETIKGDMFHAMSRESLADLQGAFADLSKYSGLRDPNKWYGDRSWMAYMRSGGAGAAVMLSHTTRPITKSLTVIDSQHERDAIAAFRDILGWMCDRSIPEVQRCHLDKAILEAASAHQSVADEIFVQMLKQQHRNPSMRSSRLGWQLLLRLCQNVTPSSELDGFVRSFFLSEISAGEFSEIAKQCIADLNVTEAPHRALGDDPERIAVPVSLIDDSCRKIYIREDAKLMDVAEKMSQVLCLKSGSEFSLFQAIHGLKGLRLLPETVEVSVLFAKWNKLEQQTGRRSHLVYKRRYLRRAEDLSVHDSVHATLTYREALSNYFTDPVLEDMDAVLRTGATIVHSEPDYFASRMESLDEAGVLEQLIPKKVLEDGFVGLSRKAWAERIIEACEDIEPPINPDEPNFMKMQRIVSLLRERKLYGCYHWLGKQFTQIPATKVSVADAPTASCKVNPKADVAANYWVCVNITGVLFISKDKADDEHFFRGFQFSEEALDRILHWAAKEDWLQLVVQIMNPTDIKNGRQPATINVQTEAAVDIAFLLTRMSVDTKSLMR